MNTCAAKPGMAKQGKLKRQDDSGANAKAEKTSVNVSLSSFHNMPYTSLGLCVAQANLKETPELRIHNSNNQRRILLQRYACKCVHLEHKASGFHNSWNSCSILTKCIRNYLRRPECQISWGICPQVPLVGALRVHLCAPRIARKPPRISA